MSQLVRDQYHGLLVPSYYGRWGRFRLRTDAVQPSTYTQAGARVGVPQADRVSRMKLEAAGSQSESGDLRVLLTQAGLPGLGGADMVWRDVAGGDSTTQWRGWDGYGRMTGWTTLRATTAALPEAHITGIRLQTGRLLFVGDQEATPFEHVIRRYDPATAAWSSATLTRDGEPASDYGPGVVELPDGTLLLYTRAPVTSASELENVDVYRSLDEGTTWELVRRKALDVGPANGVQEIAVAYNNGEMLLCVVSQSNQFLYQYASADEGMSFSYVGVWSATSGGVPLAQTVRRPCIVPSGGGYVVAYFTQIGGTRYYRVRTLGSAFVVSPLDSDGATLTDTAPATGAGHPAIAAWRDEDGSIYAAFRILDGEGYSLCIRRSTDEGLTWTSDPAVSGSTPPRYVYTANLSPSTASTGGLTYFGCASAGGRALLVTRWTATTGTYHPGSVGVVSLGGHDTVSLPMNGTAASVPSDPLDFCSWAYSDIRRGWAYLPIDKPDNVGWTGNGTGGTGNSSLTTVGGELVLQIDTVAGPSPSWWFSRSTTVAADAMVAEFVFDSDTGGSSSSLQVAATVRITDGAAKTYEVQVRAGAAAVGIYDGVAGTIIGSAFAATGQVRVLVALDVAGNVQTWRSTDWTHARKSTQGPQTTTLTNGFGGGADVCRIEWGHMVDTAACRSNWWQVGACMWAGPWRISGAAEIGDVANWTNPDELHGRPLATLAQLIHDGARVYAVDGPGMMGDSWTVQARYDYPIQAVHPDQIPSPYAARWRTTGVGANVELIWDALDDASSSQFESTIIAVAVLNANIRKLVLAGDTGVGWSTIGTLDSGAEWSGCTFTRMGDAVYPAAASGALGRPIWSGEYVGATVLLTTGGVTTARKVRANMAGQWTGSNTFSGQQPILYLDGYDGTEPASGDIVVVPRSWLGIIPNYTAQRRGYRLALTAADNPSADGYYEAGIIALCRGYVFAPSYSRDYVRTLAPTVESTVLASGRRVPVRRGRPVREIQFGWSDKVDTWPVYHGTPAHLAQTTGGSAVANVGMAAHDLALLVGSLDGELSPVVWLGRLAHGASSPIIVTDPHQFLYGAITTTPRIENGDIGHEGEGEAPRTSLYTVREWI